VLVRHAHAALAEFRQAHEEVAALASGIAGHVRIGTAITSATDLVAMAVARLAAAYPHVRVEIELGFSEALVQQLVERNLDIAIARLHPSHALSGLEFRALGEERYGIVVRGDHPLARERSLSLADLATCTWVVPPPGNVMRDKLTMLFLQQGVWLPDQVVETLALPVITSLLRASDMVAPMAIDVVRPYFDTGMLARLPVRLDLELGAAGIVTRRGGELSPAAKALVDQLSAAAGKMYSRRRPNVKIQIRNATQRSKIDD
jgi:DNA-binding transcriptional LysR family regulator